MMKLFALLGGCFLLASVASAQIGPDIAAADQTALVVWSDSTDIKFVVTDHSGRALTTASTLQASVTGSPYAASDGRGYLIVWEMDLQSVFGVLVDQSGAAGEPFRIAEAPASELMSIGWYEARYLVTYRDRDDGTVGLWLTAGGVLEDSFRVPKPAVFAPHDDVIGVVWTERTDQSAIAALSELRGGILSTGTTVAVETRIGAGASPFIYPRALAWNGSKYYLLFDRVQYPRSVRLSGEQFDADGRIDTSVILDGTFERLPTPAQLQTVGTEFVLTWLSPRGLRPLKVAWSSFASRSFELLEMPGFARTAVLPDGSILYASLDFRGLHTGVLRSRFRRAVRPDGNVRRSRGRPATPLC